jgi:AraC-like DNA-binding protein
MTNLTISGALRNGPELEPLREMANLDAWLPRIARLQSRVSEPLIITRVIFGGESLGDFACHLSMHPRTLNRRLQAVGSSFRMLLSRARSEAAQQLLGVTKMDITTIAHVLGYADSSGFSHAFRRWAGKAPVDWRAGMSPMEAKQVLGQEPRPTSGCPASDDDLFLRPRSYKTFTAALGVLPE